MAFSSHFLTGFFFLLLLETNQATLSPWTSSLGEEVSLPQPCQCLKTALVGKEV